MVLIGEYSSKITAGHRVAIPKDFRKLLGKDLIVTRGFESHLILVNEQQFSGLTQEISDRPFISGEVREVSRYLMGGAYQIQPDGQGRFVIPEKLLAHGGIGEKVVFLGLGKWVEIWDEIVWKKHELALGKSSTQIANRLAHLSTNVPGINN